jgi:hypothetical protein
MGKRVTPQARIARYPVFVVVNNDSKLAALLLGVAILRLVLLGALVAFKLQPAYCTVLVDGVEAEHFIGASR